MVFEDPILCAMSLVVKLHDFKYRTLQVRSLDDAPHGPCHVRQHRTHLLEALPLKDRSGLSAARLLETDSGSQVRVKGPAKPFLGNDCLRKPLRS